MVGFEKNRKSTENIVKADGQAFLWKGLAKPTPRSVKTRSWSQLPVFHHHTCLAVLLDAQRCILPLCAFFLFFFFWHQIKALIHPGATDHQLGNVDVASTEAVSVAREVDPDGDRARVKKKEPNF